MYSPDRSFLKQLKMLDRRLGVKFNGSNFVLTYDRGHGDPVNLHAVRTDAGGFRQPDRRDLEFLCQGDMERQTPRERFQKVSTYMSEYQQKKRRQARENLRDLTKDNKNQLRKAFERVYDTMGIGIPLKA